MSALLPLFKNPNVLELLKTFSDNEVELIKLRHGYDNPPMAIQEIAKLKNMGVEEIAIKLRDIEGRLIKMLKNN